MLKKHYKIFILAFIVLLTGRLLIAGQGYLEDNDELFYVYTIVHYQALLHFDIHPWVQAIFDMGAQPPEIVVRLGESLVAYIYCSATGVSMLHPDGLYIVGLFNVAVSLLILFVFFHILIRLDFKVPTALTGVVLLGTLVNSNLYLRHFLPYDSAVLFHLTALYILLSKTQDAKRILLAGTLSAIGLTDYFGGFMFVFINGGFLLLNHKGSFVQFLKRGVTFVIPFIILVMVYECITRLVLDRSYMGFVWGYADTITEASFSEGLYYVFLYFTLVERWWGIVLLIIFFGGLVFTYRFPKNDQTKQLLIIAVTAYLLYGSYVYFIEKMVFFGRVLQIYYPFIIIGVLCCIEQQKILSRNKVIPLMIFLALVNYGFVIHSLNSIAYPRGEIYHCGLFDSNRKSKYQYREESIPILRYQDRSLWYVDSLGDAPLREGRYDLINFCFFKNHPDDFIKSYKQYITSAGDSVIYEKLHFQSHPAYALEYNDKEGRDFFLAKQFKIRVIKKPG